MSTITYFKLSSNPVDLMNGIGKLKPICILKFQITDNESTYILLYTQSSTQSSTHSIIKHMPIVVTKDVSNAVYKTEVCSGSQILKKCPDGTMMCTESDLMPLCNAKCPDGQIKTVECKNGKKVCRESDLMPDCSITVPTFKQYINLIKQYTHSEKFKTQVVDFLIDLFPCTDVSFWETITKGSEVDTKKLLPPLKCPNTEGLLYCQDNGKKICPKKPDKKLDIAYIILMSVLLLISIILIISILSSSKTN